MSAASTPASTAASAVLARIRDADREVAAMHREAEYLDRLHAGGRTPEARARRDALPRAIRDAYDRRNTAVCEGRELLAMPTAYASEIEEALATLAPMATAT